MSDAKEVAAEDRKAIRPIIAVEKVSKLYPIGSGPFSSTRFVHAVDGVSFYIRRKQTLGLVGESGSGKSTLGRAILRLIEPTVGRIVFDGREITRLPEPALRSLRRRMQIVFQDPYSSLNPRMTVREIVGEGLVVNRIAKGAEADGMIAGMLERVGLRADMMGRYPHEFSGGQRQRIGIARALVLKPDFVVCDEPVSALDVSVQAQILNLLQELQEELGVSYLFVSHDLRAVQFMSHRVAVMYLGKIVEWGPAKDVLARRYHPYTRALYSSVPSADGKRRPGPVLEGEPPSAVEPPRGCVFHPRCERAEKGKCDVEPPVLHEIVAGSHHRTACFHPVMD